MGQLCVGRLGRSDHLGKRRKGSKMDLGPAEVSVPLLRGREERRTGWGASRVIREDSANHEELRTNPFGRCPEIAAENPAATV